MNELLDKALTVIHQEQMITNLLIVNRGLYDLGEITKEQYLQTLKEYQKLSKIYGDIMNSQQNQTL